MYRLFIGKERSPEKTNLPRKNEPPNKMCRDAKHAGQQSIKKSGQTKQFESLKFFFNLRVFIKGLGFRVLALYQG